MENKIEVTNEKKETPEIKNKSIEKEEKLVKEKKISIKELNDGNKKDKLTEEKTKEKNEKSKTSVITKNSSLSPKLFSFPYISSYECISCGLIPSPETAFEKIDEGKLICEECFKKTTPNENQEPKEEKEKEKEKDKKKEKEKEKPKYRKIKDKNKVFYKMFKNLKIKCPYKCDWEGNWIDLDNHLKICKYGFRYCKYNTIGCEFFGENNKVIEHEKNSDKLHLDMALKYIQINKIVKKKIKFSLGEKCMTTVHPHEMVYMYSLDWNCDGRRLPNGCYSVNYSFPRDKARYRCRRCDFDLCDKCIVKYVINK